MFPPLSILVFFATRILKITIQIIVLVFQNSIIVSIAETISVQLSNWGSVWFFSLYLKINFKITTKIFNLTLAHLEYYYSHLIQPLEFQLIFFCLVLQFLVLMNQIECQVYLFFQFTFLLSALFSYEVEISMLSCSRILQLVYFQVHYLIKELVLS